MYPATWLKSTLPLLLLVLLITVLAVSDSSGEINLAVYCQERCYLGRGGNLCNCNAYHFAGKRGDAAGAESHSFTQTAQDDENFRDVIQANDDFTNSIFQPRENRQPVADNNDDQANVVVEGFFGVEGGERSAVGKLKSLLEAALSHNATGNEARTSGPKEVKKYARYLDRAAKTEVKTPIAQSFAELSRKISQ